MVRWTIADTDPNAIWEPGNIPFTSQTTLNYQQLCALLLNLGGDYPDGFVPPAALDLLKKATLFHVSGGRGDLTDLGEEVCERLEDGGDAPEIRAVANA